MVIGSLCLKNFRNYEELQVEFSENVNVLYGNNGQGKTNILEALFLCAVGKSFRTSKETEMIRNDQEEFRVGISIRQDINESVSVSLNRKKQKAIQVNGLYLRKMGQLMGSLLAVLFSPEDMLLISEGPSLRRRFLDIAISQLKPSYFYNLQQYNKIVAQKNTLLRDIKRFGKKNDVLSVWNQQQADIGFQIMKERIFFTEKVSYFAKQKHEYLSRETERLEIGYDSSILKESGRELSSELFFELLERNEEREVEREISLLGPHRDDLSLFLNGMDLKKYGSQGQKRTAVLSMKMAEWEIMKQDTGRMPLLLLDDVLSELDGPRQELLLSCTAGAQVFLTCTSKNSFKNAPNSQTLFLCIQDGQIDQKEK